MIQKVYLKIVLFTMHSTDKKISIWERQPNWWYFYKNKQTNKLLNKIQLLWFQRSFNLYS